MHAYDATSIALDILQETADPKIVRKRLLSMSPFQGVQGELAFDSFGDLKDPQIYLARIIDGTFVISD